VAVMTTTAPVLQLDGHKMKIDLRAAEKKKRQNRNKGNNTNNW
jgi:hypothetical protein